MFFLSDRFVWGLIGAIFLFFVVGFPLYFISLGEPRMAVFSVWLVFCVLITLIAIGLTISKTYMYSSGGFIWNYLKIWSDQARFTLFIGLVWTVLVAVSFFFWSFLETIPALDPIPKSLLPESQSYMPPALPAK
ncbi:MAG: hypothetical protein EOM26_10745 [Alphaproteobacteria bacterium]|nr:hypothetical protein [Alphaproteobacteria bacterium]